MKIALVSDTHEEFWRDLHNPDNWINKLEDLDYDVLVLAGDISAKPTQLEEIITKCSQVSKHVLFVDGNHEYYGQNYSNYKDRIAKFAVKLGNVDFLDNSLINIDSVTFFGGCGWTNFGDDPLAEIAAFNGINDFRRIGDFSTQKSKDLNLEFENNLHEYYKYIDIDVVVSHFSPLMQSCHEKWGVNPLNRYFHNNMSDVISQVKPELWLHGHTHDENDYIYENTRVISHPRGYPGENSYFTGSYKPLIIEI